MTNAQQYFVQNYTDGRTDGRMRASKYEPIVQFSGELLGILCSTHSRIESAPSPQSVEQETMMNWSQG